MPDHKDDRCNGSDIVSSQAFETLAWIISPEVVGSLGTTLMITKTVVWDIREEPYD